MKKYTILKFLWFLFLFGLGHCSMGQNFGPTFKGESDYIFAPLNKGFMQTRTLYDRVAPVANLYLYDGSTNAPTSNSDHFHQAIYELYNATYDVSGQNLADPNQIASSVSNYYNSYQHPMGVICHNFEFMDSLATQKNLVTAQNGQLYDVANRSASPYIPSTAILAAPLAPPEGYIRAGTHYFSVNTSFFVGNQTGQMDHIDFNFDDGQGWHTVYIRDLIFSTASPSASPSNPNWAVNLTAGSTKTITVRITFKNGQVKQTQTTIKAGPAVATPVAGCGCISDCRLDLVA